MERPHTDTQRPTPERARDSANTPAIIPGPIRPQRRGSGRSLELMLLGNEIGMELVSFIREARDPKALHQMSVHKVTATHDGLAINMLFLLY